MRDKAVNIPSQTVLELGAPVGAEVAAEGLPGDESVGPLGTDAQEPSALTRAPAWQIFAVGTLYGRGTLLGFSRRWERKVTNRSNLGRVIAEEIQRAEARGEGLEIERA